MNIHVIAYTYDADTHCRGCAGKRFGPNVHSIDPRVQPRTKDGDVGVIFDIDERIDDLCCGTCHKLIANSTLES